jgi:hypothetical protein
VAEQVIISLSVVLVVLVVQAAVEQVEITRPQAEQEQPTQAAAVAADHSSLLLVLEDLEL